MGQQENNNKINRSRGYKLTSERKAEYFDRVYRRADWFMDLTLLLNVLISFLLATFNETYFMAMVVSGAVSVSYLITRLALPKLQLFRFVGALGLSLYLTYFLQATHGVFAFHLFIGVFVVVIVPFQNWKLLALFAGATLVQYFFLALGQAEVGSEWYLLPAGYLTQANVIWLLVVASVIFTASGFFSYRLAGGSIEWFTHHAFSEEQMNSIDRSIEFANEMAKGNLDYSQDKKSTDKLGQALRDMQVNLLEAKDKEYKEKFVNVGMAEVSEILRDFDDDLEQIARRLVSKLVNYFDANQGGLYLVEYDDDKKEQPYLNLIAFYAYQRQKYADARVEVGKGLLGQAFLEKSCLHLTEIPEGYITTTSGLGKATPNALLIVPLIVNEEIYGMVELASFNSFEKYQITFMEQLAESIASTIANFRNTAYTKRLLEESRELAEQMFSQEEEMRQNMEELQATQEELARKETRMYEEMDLLKSEHLKEVKALKAKIEELEGKK